MDLDAAISRYVSNPQVAKWLFSTEQVKTISAKALDASFVYAIGFGVYDFKTPRTMNIEDMLIVTGVVDTFVLGVIWGLAQPHVFSRTPLMLDKKPVCRRFAVDFSSRDALEFMEFVSFDDGKLIVMFRQFLHTNDHSLPVVACARLHAASQVEQTLGPVLMRADLLEATCCPKCQLVGKRCRCEFSSYAPNGMIRVNTHTWSEFTDRFMNKTRVGAIKFQITAVLPNVGKMRIVDDDLPCVNVMQRGNTEYMSLLRRKAVFGFGIDVVAVRSESFVLAKSMENDFLDLHNSYVTRKRDRVSYYPEDLATALLDCSSSQTPDISTQDLLGVTSHDEVTNSDSVQSVQSVDDVLPTIFPGIFDVDSSRYMTELTDVKHDEVDMHGLIPSSDVTAPLTKMEPVASSNIVRGAQVTTSTSKYTPQGEKSTLELLNDIESMLSPQGGETGDVPSSYALGEAVTLNEILQPGPGLRSQMQWSTSASSEYGDAVDQKQKTVVEPQAKRKRTSAKRAKASSAAASGSGSGLGSGSGSRASGASGDSATDSEKKHACEHCSSRFKMRGDLLRHVKIVHEGKKMHTCKYCGKAFGHSGHLNRHISSVHLQERRFKCQFCGFQFFQQSHLQSHIGHIHAAKKSFACNKCSFRASNRSALKVHMDDHHGECAYESGLAMRSSPVSLQTEAQLYSRV